MSINIQQLSIAWESDSLAIKNWSIEANQHWGIFSTSTQTTHLLTALFSGEIEPESGEIQNLPRLAVVSLQAQQALLEEEIANDDTDFLDRVDTGSTVQELLQQVCATQEKSDALLERCDITHLKERGFRLLSTGETRRVMLARALAETPELLVLDEPYVGLDIAHQASLTKLLNELSQELQLIIITSRENEIPDCITHIGLLSSDALENTMSKEEWLAHPVLHQYQQQAKEKSENMLALMARYQQKYDYPDPLVKLINGKVEYHDGLIFKDVDWEIQKGEHWQIRGPNGCGKTTLLNLIFGDHPQCYSNNITLFGMQRGTGESIWDIKQHIGMVSSALHLQYRVNCSALKVLLSGFYDSIGLYTQPSKKEVLIAQDWLALLGMSKFENKPFQSFDYGQQRLLLIARALIKQPRLLMLDEPYQGLDFINRKLVMNTLDMLAQYNLCQLLYVTHYTEDALNNIKHFVDFTGDGVVISHKG